MTLKVSKVEAWHPTTSGVVSSRVLVTAEDGKEFVSFAGVNKDWKVGDLLTVKVEKVEV